MKSTNWKQRSDNLESENEIPPTRVRSRNWALEPHTDVDERQVHRSKSSTYPNRRSLFRSS